MGFLQGSPLPDVTVTTGKTQAAPEYYTDYLTDLSKVGTDALKTTAETGVAAYDPMQTLGYGKVEDAAKAYLPGITSAQTTAGNLTAGLDLNRISQFMNPYQTNVVDEMERLAQQMVRVSGGAPAPILDVTPPLPPPKPTPDARSSPNTPIPRALSASPSPKPSRPPSPTRPGPPGTPSEACSTT